MTTFALSDFAAFARDVAAGATTVLPPPVPFEVEPASGSAADSAYQKMVADKANSKRFDGVRATYNTAFALSLKSGSRQGLWQPWRYLRPYHLFAAIAVAELVDRKPEQVLALWLVEGQSVLPNLFEPGGLEIGPVATAADCSRIDIAAYVRAQVFYSVFGADALAAYVYDASVRDNVLVPPGGAGSKGMTNNGAYAAGVQAIAALGVPGPASDSPSDLDSYFLSIGGALVSLRMLDASDSSVLTETTIPAGTSILVKGSLSRASVATWLYVQAALFQTYQGQYEQLAAADYGTDADLSAQPWVPYVGWNGSMPAQYALFSAKSKGFATLAGSVQTWYGADTFGGDPEVSDLPARLLNNYYPDQYQKYTQSGGTSNSIAAVPFCTAVTLKYLSEAMSVWFE